jgi:hypothetical protein
MKLTWWETNIFLWSEQTCSSREEGDFWVYECDHLTDFTLVVVSKKLIFLLILILFQKFRMVLKKTPVYVALI